MRRRCLNAVVVGALAVGMVVGWASAAMATAIAGPTTGAAAAVIGPLATGLVRTPPVSAPTSAAAVVRPTGIDACVARLDPQLDIGYERIAARCPELMRQLETGAWAPWLPRGWKETGNDLSAGSLKEFRELVERESGARDVTNVDPPDVHALQPILAALASDRSETGWSRFKSWLRSLLERREPTTDESWFSRMVSQAGISQSVIRLITYGALAAVIVLAGIIVANELRTAGLLSQRRGMRRRGRPQTSGGATGTGWDAIEQAPLRDRPRLLLELIVRRLTDRGLLPPSGALTVRELTREARLADDGDRARLTELALVAERIRYAWVEDSPTLGVRAQASRASGPGMRGSNAQGPGASASGLGAAGMRGSDAPASGFEAAGVQPDSLEESVARGRELLQRLEAGAGGQRRNADASRLDASAAG